LDSIAADIESGKITTPQSAVKRIEATARRAFKDARADGSDYMILPIIGG
jgi:hypothetical protein